MSSLQTLINHPDIPPAYRSRYSTAIPGTSIIPFVQWANDLLEELQERGFLASLKKERGVLVERLRWLEKPGDFLSLLKVYDPENEEHEFRVEEIENKFKIKDYSFLEEETANQITSAAFGTYGTEAITCTDLTDTTKYAEDYFEDYLFLITAGTLADTGIVVYGNDAATNPGGTRLVFSHAQSSVLSGTKVTAARLVPPQYYLMMQYWARITEVTALSDEMPIEDDCEYRLVPAWMRWKCERALMALSRESQAWEKQKDDILFQIESKRSSRVITPSRGRRLIGFERNLNGRIGKPHPDYSEF
jgi:hypothetical protein